MKKVLYILTLFASSIFFAQINKSVKFVICNDAVGNVEMFDVYKKEMVSKVFYKREKLPQYLKKFSYLADSGLTEIKLNKNFGTPDILSLALLNEQHHLEKDIPVVIEGYLIKDTSVNIYSEMIKKIVIIDEAGKRYLLISTSDK